MCESPSNSPLSWLLVHRLLREGTLDWLEELWGEQAKAELLDICRGGLRLGKVGGAVGGGGLLDKQGFIV